MKIAFSFIWLLISISTVAQQAKQQDIKHLIELIQIKPTMQNMVDQGIIYYQKQKPTVPQQVWKDIKSSIDYQPYLNLVEQIFDENYTQAEIQSLIYEVKENPKVTPRFKQIVQQLLYDTGKEFGENYANYIKQILVQKGH